MNLTARVTPSNEVLHCIDHLELDVRDGHQMTWSGNDDLAKVVAWIDDVLNVLDATPKPIVWDGTAEALVRILTALNGRAAWGGTNLLGDLRLVNPGTVGLISLQGRIQIVGDSFAILPPEATS